MTTVVPSVHRTPGFRVQAGSAEDSEELAGNKSDGVCSRERKNLDEGGQMDGAKYVMHLVLGSSKRYKATLVSR